jgi:hypothetical protein
LHKTPLRNYTQFGILPFRPLDYGTYLSHFGEKVVRSPERAKFVFLEWLDNFYHRSALFYHAQYLRLRNLAEKEFRKEHGLREDDYFDSFLQEEWEEHYKRVGLEKNYEDYRAMSDVANRARTEIRKQRNALSITEHTERELSDERPRLKEINALWFNTTIRNDEQTAIELKELPYDFYLKTKHWGKVRAAQMLIHKAVCQEQYHYAMGESWYTGDWESDIHVHHLTYENRGNERYSDLVLLCASHHEAWHKEFDAFGKSSIALADDE